MNCSLRNAKLEADPIDEAATSIEAAFWVEHSGHHDIASSDGQPRAAEQVAV